MQKENGKDLFVRNHRYGSRACLLKLKGGFINEP